MKTAIFCRRQSFRSLHRSFREIIRPRVAKFDLLKNSISHARRVSLQRKSCVASMEFSSRELSKKALTLQVVLVPGLLCDASIWAAQIAALKSHADVAVADLSQLDSLEDMARAALGLREGPVVVIGHSMGARVALEMFRAAPNRIAKLGLLDTGVHPVRDGEEADRQVLVDLAFKRGMRALADRWLPPMVHKTRRSDPLLMEPLKAMVMRATPEQHHRQIRALLNRADARPLLPTIRCPTLVMVGRQDCWSPVAQHEEIASLAPHARLMIIEDSGHMSPVEQPDQVSNLLLSWLGFGDVTKASLQPAAEDDT
jgi:pimeloyl-ACP methyl ester carboxylesterase